MVAARMAMLEDALQQAESPEQTLSLLYQIDQEFKSMGINPGTTADLTVATLFTVLLEEMLSA
jgi:triphosphoribosyl-dephospho-CoA synthase